MKKMSSAVIVATCLLGWAARSSSVQADTQVQPQRNDPDSCTQEDKECLVRWYQEYKIGIIEEFRRYRAVEDTAGKLLVSGDRTDAAYASGVLIRGGHYKHNHWKFPDYSEGLKRAGIQKRDFEAVTWDCRLAISHMKFLLIDLQSHPESIGEDRAEYLKHAGRCERAFGLEPHQSALRGMTNR